jgi:hypothetical protein
MCTLLVLCSYTQGQNRLYDASIIDSTLLAKAKCRVIYTQFLEQVTESVDKEVAVVRCY